MKRFIVCIMVFVLMLWFSGNSVHAKPPNRLQIISSEVEMDSSDNLIFNIDGLNFGVAPLVSLGGNQLTVDLLNSSNDHIEATLAGGILPGTYRLSVARNGFEYSHPEKADSLDVTISAGESSDTAGESSGTSNTINIYEITETGIPTDGDMSVITATCECADGNDIALYGGFKITYSMGSYPEIAIMESKIHREAEIDYYQVEVKNHSYDSNGQIIGIAANVTCLSIP